MIFEKITPYKGIGEIKLYDHIDNVKKYLQINNIYFEERIYDQSDCYIKYNWHVLIIDDCIKLFFSEGNYKLFKIYIYDGCKAKLPNEIEVGMSIEKSKEIDTTLTYDDFDEMYISSNGYWLEDDSWTNTVASIQVFVKEIDDEDFLLCKW